MRIGCNLCHKEIGEEKESKFAYFLASPVHEECLSNHHVVKAIELVGKGQSFLNQCLLWDVLKKFQGEILRDRMNSIATKREKKESVQY